MVSINTVRTLASESFVRIFCSRHSTLPGALALWAMIAGLLFVAQPTAAQTYLSEDFESGLPSANFSADGSLSTKQWSTTSAAYAGATSAYFKTLAGTSNGYLLSKKINLSTSTRPQLTFYHIAALERYYDQAIVEVSTNDGITWIIPSNQQYFGNSWRKTGANVQNSTTTTFPDGPYFDAQSRPEWDAKFTATSTLPTAAIPWYKETFDLSAYKSASVRVRFRVKSNGTNDYYGWRVDNISIQEAPTTRISGTRVIGTGGFPSFSAAVQALADSGVGTGGVTFLVSPGTYTDSVQFGNWDGVSASNRVRFVANGGVVTLQRGGTNNYTISANYTYGINYTTPFEAGILMTGARYVTLSGITIAQQNRDVSTGQYSLDVGIYMTNGCQFDSIVNCSIQLYNHYYTTWGFMVASNYFSTAPGVRNISNKFINDTVVAWNGGCFTSQYGGTFDSLNEFSGTSQGSAWLNLGQTSAPTTTTASYSTMYGIQMYGQNGLAVKNVKLNIGSYGPTSTAGSYTAYGFYAGGGNLIEPVIDNNLLNNLGYAPSNQSNSLWIIHPIYIQSSNIIRPVISNNTISDIFEYYGYGIYMASTTDAVLQNNSIARISTGYMPSYASIYATSNYRPRIIGNKVKDVRLGDYSTATSTYYGIYSVNQGPTAFYNNSVTGISINSTALSNVIYGIYFTANTVANDSICHNLVFLDDNHSTPTSTSYAFYVTPYTSFPGANLHIYNNIFGNRMSNATGSVAYDYYRSTTAGSIFSDFNDLYCNTTGSGDPSHITGYYGGTTCYQVSDWKTAGLSNNGMDGHSFAELPPFGLDSLHMSTAVATRLESAGKPLTTVLTDIDGDARAALCDIGPDEGSFTLSTTDDAGPAITFTKGPRFASTSSVSIAASITDPSGVATGASAAPRLYYRSLGGSLTFSSVTGSQSGSTWTFALGSMAASAYQYYIAAQDNVGTPNVSTYPPGGSGATPPGSTAPSLFDTLRVVGMLNGDYLVGGLGANFSTLKAACDSLNNSGVSGPVRFLLNSSTMTETVAPIILGPIFGSSAANTVTIKPNTGMTVALTATASVPQMVFVLESYAASNVIIDGSNSVGGTSRDLTITAGNSTADNRIPVFIKAGVGPDGVAPDITNVTIKNLNIRGSYPLSTSANGVGILFQSAAPTGSYPYSLAGTKMNGCTITNNTFGNLFTGIQILGDQTGTTSNPIKNLMITNNIIGTSTDSMFRDGMNFTYCDSITIDNNDISHFTHNTSIGSTTSYGVLLSTACTNFKITRNKIHNFNLAGTTSVGYGIYESAALPTKSLIANNMIYDIHMGATTGGTSSTGPAYAGIFIASGAYDIIANNTVALFDTASSSTSVSAQYTEAFGTSTGAFSETVLNNIFYNGLVVGPTVGRNIGMAPYYGTSTFARSDNNFIYTPGPRGILGHKGYLSQQVTTMDSLRGWTGGDVFSWNLPAYFVSLTDPHISTSIGTRIESGGIPVAGVSIDIDGTARNATTPDIGADEANFIPALVDVAVNSVTFPQQSQKVAAGSGFRSVISVTNNGTQDAYDIPIVTRLIDSTSLAVTTVSGTIDSIRAGETRTVTIDSISIPLARTYGLQVYANYLTEANRLNDSATTVRLIAVPGLNGLYTVGVGQWAPTIKAAFDSLVNFALAGPVTFSLTDATYQEPAITSAYIGTNGVIAGASPTRRLRIKPAAGVSPTIHFYGSTTKYVPTVQSTTTYCGLGLQNTSYLTIDGSNTENGTTKNTTVVMHPSVSGSTFWGIVLTSTTGDSIKNIVLIDSIYTATSSTSSSAPSDNGIMVSYTAATAPASDNVISNNTIRDDFYAIYLYGSAFGGIRNTTVANNLINRFWRYAIYSTSSLNSSIIGNTIQNDTVVYTATYTHGIQFDGTWGGAEISGNKIWKWRTMQNGAPYYYGINLIGTNTSPVRVANNILLFDHDTSTGSLYVWGGIMLTQSGSLTTCVDNTIYIGNGSGLSGGSAYGIYHTAGDAIVKNNIVANNRKSSGSHYAIYNSTSAYNFVCDNNVVNATGSATAYDFYWLGSTYTPATFATYKSASGQDAHSWLEMPPFIDTVGGNVGIQTTVATRVEGHAVVIPGIPTDYFGTVRDTRYPDVGAIEGSYTPLRDVDLSALSMNIASGSRYLTGNPITAIATFQELGVTTASNTPITYQVFDPSGALAFTASNTITSLAASASTAAGSIVFTPLTRGIWRIKAFASNPADEYVINDTVTIPIRLVDGLIGTYEVGVGRWAPTIKAAVDSLADQGLRGAVVFSLTDNTYSEPSLAINPPFNESAANTITFKPATSVQPVVTFNSTGSTPWGFRINSAKYMTIDGSNSVGGTTRDMKWQIGNPAGLATILVADSIGGNGATSTTIKNTKFYSGGTSAAYYGICVGGSTAGSAGSNNSVTIQNNEVRNAGTGICAAGLSLNPTTNLIITQNTIGPAVGDNTSRIGVDGIRLGYVTSPLVTGNEIMGVYSTANSVAGIELTAGATSVSLTKNKIHDLEAKSSSYRALGVLDNGGSATQFVNNMIWHVTSGMANATNAGVNAGIFLGSTNGATLYFNSIYLTGNRDTVAATGGLAQSAALYLTSGASAVVSRNNIYASKQTEAAGGAKAYGVVFENATSISSADNDMFSGLGTKAGLVARIGTTDYTRMADLRGALGAREANGFGADVLFVSDADLHINPTTPSLVESGGATIAGITDDVDGDTRSAIKPDVGADEGAFVSAVDLVAVSIDNPIPNTVFRPFVPTTAPVVTFRNAATGTGTNIPVSFVTIDSLVNSRTVSTKFIPTLGPNASTQVTFDQLALPDIGSYGLYAYSDYGFDVDNTNDTTGVISVKVCAPMFGTYYVGVGRDFASLTLAAKTLRDCGVQAQIEMILTDAVYNEPGPITFGGISGLTSAVTITVRPNTGVNAVMNIPTQLTVDYGIQLDSVNWVTLNGSNTTAGSTRNWRINLTGANTNASVVSVRDGSSDAVKNLVLHGLDMTAGNGVMLQPTRIRMTNTTISNNDIQNVQTGINVMTTPLVDSAITIQNNAITRWSQTGILIGDMAKNVMIRGNTVRSDTTTVSTAMTGISVTGPNTTNVELGANRVMDLTTSGTNPVLKGIALSNTASASTRVYDNMVSLGRNTSMTTATLYGVQLQPGSNAWIQNNTIAIGGSGVTSGSSSGVYVDAPINLTFYNNIVSNVRSNSTGAGKHYAFNSPNSPAGYFQSDYNDLYAFGSGGVIGRAIGMDIPTLPMWRMITNGTAWGLQDRNSFSEAPSFVGTSDLHLTLAPSRSQNGGKPGLVGPNGQQDYDIDGNVRAYIADVGADELDGPRNMRLKGAYTIGGVASPYATFKDALSALNMNGVDGAVDFYLAQGTEMESTPLRFVAADGIGPNWPVRIHPASGYTSEISGMAPTGQNLTTVVLFDSAANNITFDGQNTTNNGQRSLTIRNATADFANSAIVFVNGASSNSVRNANVLTPLANVRIDPLTDGFGVISLIGGVYGGNLSSNLIDNDSIANGTRGVFAYGAAANWRVSNLTVRKSTISDFNESGIFFGAGTTNSFADGNRITTNVSPGAASTVRGIRLASDDNAISNRAGNNWIINLRSTGTSNLSGIDLTDGQQPMIFNNFISLDDYTTGSVRGIDEASTSTTIQPTAARIFFNSINIYGDKSPNSMSDYAILIGAGDNIGNADSIVNNVYSLHRNNYGPNVLFAMGLAQFSDVTYANNNDYYTPAGSVAQVGAINYSTLSALRAAPSWSTRDANAITGDPVFKSNLDLHIGAYTSALFNKAQYLTSVTTDIDGQGRDLAPRTEIGADENGAFGVLPVELMSLEARGMDKQVALNFSTANESNVRGFAIMRSEGDNTHFTEIANASTERSLVAHGQGGRTTDYSFTDNGVTNGTTYYYQVASLESDGSRRAYEKIAVATPSAPLGFAIDAAYPNPYRTNTGDMMIGYSVNVPTESLTLSVVDLTGQTVRTLVTGAVAKAGSFSAVWNGADDNGSELASGTYVISMTATIDGAVRSTTQKVVLTK